MKGISTILAMILIVIIVVALIGLTYTFAANLFQTTTSAASNTTIGVTTNIQKTIYISTAACSALNSSHHYVNFTIKNTGTQQINKELGAVLDGGDVSSITLDSSSATISNTVLNQGASKTFGMTVPRIIGRSTKTLTVSAPAGEVSSTLTGCPA